MNYTYKVPIIPQNLDKHETISQISEALRNIQNVTDIVFMQINKKLVGEGKKISTLSERINVVNKKISQLKGSKTATQVFSSSRYPGTDVNRDYISLFHDCPVVEYKTRTLKIKNYHTTHESLDKLQLYRVNVPHEFEGNKSSDLVPEKVNFVNDLHITTSRKNLYTKYAPNDALNSQLNDNISKIDEAPHSISDKSSFSKTVPPVYTYAPQIGEVPALEVPLDLPDLPGVADNLHYENDCGPIIAPSAFLESLSNLPVIEATNEVEPIVPSNINIPPPPPPPIDISVTIPELPKPPTILDTELPKQSTDIPKPILNTQTIEASTTETTQHIPANNMSQQNGSTSKRIEPAAELRSSLMEAIRNAGGSGKAKLRTVAPKDEDTMQSKKMEGGDLMADLHKKLFMRRKGISGVKKTEENMIDPNTALGKISAMIPAPDETNFASTSNDEEDWD